MKLTVAVLALLCLSMGVNATKKTLGVKVDKTAKGIHVDMPDITVPKVTMPEVKVAVQVKKPTINTTKIDLPDFTIPTKEITVPAFPKPEIDLSALTALLNKAKPNMTMSNMGVDLSEVQALLSKEAPKIDVHALLALLLSAKNVMPTVNLPSIDKQSLAGAFSKGNVTFDLNSIIDKAALQQSIAELLASVEKPNININGIVDAIKASRNSTTGDLTGLLSLLTQKKDIKADLVGILNSLKQDRTINLTLPTMPKPAVNIASIMETVKTLKNVTASIVGDDLKSAAILSWLKDAGFYQIQDAVNSAGKGKGKGKSGAQGGAVTINLGKQ